jgi:hypothetical protein
MNKGRTTPTGLRCGVLVSKDIGDCTFNGVTSRYDSVVLIGEGVEGPFDGEGGTPVLKLCIEPFQYPDEVKDTWETGVRVCARPVDPKTGEPFEGHFMMGGNFVYSCDSRWPEIGGRKAPIPVHDRSESESVRQKVWEAYPGA